MGGLSLPRGSRTRKGNPQHDFQTNPQQDFLKIFFALFFIVLKLNRIYKLKKLYQNTVLSPEMCRFKCYFCCKYTPQQVMHPAMIASFVVLVLNQLVVLKLCGPHAYKANPVLFGSQRINIFLCFFFFFFTKIRILLRKLH